MSTKSEQKSAISIRTTILLCLFFLIFDMILPLTGEWYQNIIMFPSETFGPFTFSVILNIILVCIVLNIYAKPIVFRSYRNYMESNSMDMETLISLGCMSAFLLFLFFMGRNTYEFLKSLSDDKSTYRITH